MVDNNPLLKYMIKGDKDDFIHTSAYARVQNGGSVGAASSQSFEERQRIESNRQIVRKYNDSKLVQQARVSSPRAEAYTKPAGLGGNVPGATPGGVARGDAMIQRRFPGPIKK